MDHGSCQRILFGITLSIVVSKGYAHCVGIPIRASAYLHSFNKTNSPPGPAAISWDRKSFIVNLGTITNNAVLFNNSIGDARAVNGVPIFSYKMVGTNYVNYD